MKPDYKKLTLSEQLMVRMLAKLMVLDPVFVEDTKDEVGEEVFACAEAYYISIRETK
jgi:hypothetical protein